MVSANEQRQIDLPIAPLLFLTSIFLLSFLARIVFGPLLPILEQNLHLSHGQAGSLFLILSLGYSGGLSASGFVSARLSHRGTVVLSVVTVGIALLIIAAGSSVVWIISGLLAIGIAAGFYLPSGVSTITSLAAPQGWGKAFAIHEIAPNLSFIFAPIIVEAVVRVSGWRTVPALLGAAAIIIGFLYFRFGKGGDFTGEPPNPVVVKKLLSTPSFWMMMAVFGLGIGASLGVYTMIPLYLVTERGFERTQVNELLAVSRIPGLGLAFLAGWISDRLGQKLTIGSVFFLTGVTTIMLGAVTGELWTVTAVFLQPTIAVCFFPAGFSALSRISAQEERNITVSLITPAGFLIGGGVIPACIGLAGENASFALGICVVGGLLLVSPLLLVFLNLSQRKG